MYFYVRHISNCALRIYHCWQHMYYYSIEKKLLHCIFQHFGFWTTSHILHQVASHIHSHIRFGTNMLFYYILQNPFFSVPFFPPQSCLAVNDKQKCV